MSAGTLVMVEGQKEPRKTEWGALIEAEANRTAGWRPLPELLPRAEQGRPLSSQLSAAKARGHLCMSCFAVGVVQKRRNTGLN